MNYRMENERLYRKAIERQQTPIQACEFARDRLTESGLDHSHPLVVELDRYLGDAYAARARKT